MITGHSLVLGGDDNSGDEGLEGNCDISDKATNELLEHVNSIPDVSSCLSNINSASGNVFITHFGHSALSAGRTPL